MVPERPTAVLEGIPHEQVYPVAILVLLVGSSVALSMGREIIGVVGVILLSLLSLAYGAMQSPEERF